MDIAIEVQIGIGTSIQINNYLLMVDHRSKSPYFFRVLKTTGGLQQYVFSHTRNDYTNGLIEVLEEMIALAKEDEDRWERRRSM